MAEERPVRPRRAGSVIRAILGFIGRIIFIVFTLALTGACTAAIFSVIFMDYVDERLRPTLAVDLDSYVMDQTSIIYYRDPRLTDNGNDGWVEDQVLHGEENRILVSFDQIPAAMWQAAVAIEDHRFLEHEGVDWYRTAGAVLNTFTGERDTFGGSTITQQVLKNITKDNDPYIIRKVREIFRALDFEKDHTKEEILELYLNTIYFGKGCYGVQTAANFYFGKDVSELDAAECACLIAITNNPSMYGPMYDIVVKVRGDDGEIIESTPRAMNKQRQENILWRMYDPELGLCFLTEEEYVAARDEELQFIERGRSTAEDVAAAEAEAAGKSPYYSWFVDQIIKDVAADLVSAGIAKENDGVNQLIRGGYRIYSTMDPTIQEKADAVYRNRKNLDVTSRDGQPMCSAITILEPSTGYIRAIVGDMGEKPGNRVWSFADDPHQVGSSIKPLTCYVPALNSGAITPASALDDYPVMTLNGSPWPRNTPAGYGGITTVKTGVRKSINTIAVRTLQALGLENSYLYATENMKLNLVPEDLALAPLAMGGLTRGLSTIEMAAAYGAIANKGVYNKPKTYSRVEDAEGRIVLDNRGEGKVIMKETTAYFMTDMLESAVQSGTGTPAQIEGMHVAGKTGTTSDNYDRYFVGYTPYYVAAVWAGYKSNARINYSGNPAVDMWKKVMGWVHDGLPDKEFPRPDGIVTVQVCQDSGLLATSACRNEIRGNRVISVEMAAGTEPTETCELHVTRKYCRAGKCLAGNSCPSSSTTYIGLLSVRRENYGSGVYAEDSPYTTSGIRGTCSVHTGSRSSSSSRNTSSSSRSGSSSSSSSNERTSGGGSAPSAPEPDPEPQFSTSGQAPEGT